MSQRQQWFFPAPPKSQTQNSNAAPLLVPSTSQVLNKRRISERTKAAAEVEETSSKHVKTTPATKTKQITSVKKAKQTQPTSGKSKSQASKANQSTKGKQRKVTPPRTPTPTPTPSHNRDREGLREATAPRSDGGKETQLKLDQFHGLLGPEPMGDIRGRHEYGEDDYVDKHGNDLHPITDNSGQQCRIIPCGFAPLQGSRLQSFNYYTQRAHLDNHHLAFGRQLCNISLSNRQHMTSIQNELTRQITGLRDLVSKMPAGAASTGTAAAAAPWLSKEDSIELRIATKNILRGDLQAYTATKDKLGDKITLPLSLYATVMDSIMSNPDKWKKRLLPPGYGKNPKVTHVKSYKTLVNNGLKEVRKEFEGILLENINLPSQNASTGVGPIPTLNGIIANSLVKLVAVSLSVTKSLNKWAICKRLDMLIWYARFLRMNSLIMKLLMVVLFQRLQACHWGFYKVEYKDGASLWSVVDKKLEYLRDQSSRYRHAFAILCLTEDSEIFGNKKTLEETLELTSFPVPDKTAIRDVIKHIDKTWGKTVPEEEALHQIKRPAGKHDGKEDEDKQEEEDEQEEDEQEQEEEEEEEEENEDKDQDQDQDE
ncbi:uncharacterized protein MELLADRAFT_95082 [Melampsora larici-populina 98AG31]|uniref:Uncharacterized protein n=1 Tax=Melampsora larici-populina (strain 98AG31 / pathotype 3-4-7) TaxID=747676 RepID=F4S927_MELLP|nr:uncharacterized protein MELLADRAFT_95082 [Melampsora larici-populina 98AG31]EGF98842.1 hypothetical protein MELLADRAFT_95082 [Melampsora larici-populina 98AG31]